MRRLVVKTICLVVVFVLLLTSCSNINLTKEYFVHAEITPVINDANAMITIVSDDGFYETGVNLNKLAEKHNIKITIAGVVEIIDPYLQQWIAMEKEGNIELISHSYSHKKMSEENAYSEDELQHEITESIEYFKTNFLTDQISFICPENVMSNRGFEILKDNNIYSIRKGDRGENSLTPCEGVLAAQWYNLFTWGIGDLDSTEWRNSLIDSAINNKTWLIEMWHDVYSTEPEGLYQEISFDSADEHLAYISKKVETGEVAVASLVDATKYLYERKYAELDAKLCVDVLTVTLSTDTDVLPKDIFDYPLTVKIPVPSTWMNKKIVADNQEITLKNINNVDYIIFNMLPNGEDVVIKAIK